MCDGVGLDRISWSPPEWVIVTTRSIGSLVKGGGLYEDHSLAPNSRTGQAACIRKHRALAASRLASKGEAKR